MKIWIKDQNFYKKALGITFPIAAQQLITVGVNMMDTIMIGSVGESSLSAVSLANQFITVFQILCMGLGMGASVLVARYYGMKEISSLKKTVAIVLRLGMITAFLFCLATIITPSGIMRIYTDEAEIVSKGAIYLRWSAITYFLTGLSMICAIILRCVEQVKIPLYTSVGALFINVGANWVFIFGHLGAPRMEEAGTALGTLIARIFEVAVIVGFMFFKDDHLKMRVRDLTIKTRDLWGEYIRVSLPVLISDGIYALGSNSVAMVIGRLGAQMVAANAITMVTQQLSSVLTAGMAQAGAIVTGHTLGSGDRQKAQEQGEAFFGLGIFFGTLAAIIIMIISSPMIRAYHVSAETAAIAS